MAKTKKKSKSKSITRVVAKRLRTSPAQPVTTTHRKFIGARKSSSEIVHVVVSTQGTRQGALDLSGITVVEALDVLRSAFPDRVVDTGADELVDIRQTAFYQQMTKHMTPGKYLRVYREREGWSQSDLGRRLGIHQRQHVSRLERGERGISKDLAKRLAKLFDVPVERFI